MADVRGGPSSALASLEDVWARLGDSAPPDEWRRALEVAGAQPDRVGRSWLGDCSVQVVRGTVGWQLLTRGLASVAPLGLSVAPRRIRDAEMSDGAHVVLLHYPAVAGEVVVPVEHDEALATRSAAHRALADLERLADAGLWHPGASDADAWRLGRDSGTLVLSGWEEVERIDSGDRSEVALARDLLEELWREREGLPALGPDATFDDLLRACPPSERSRRQLAGLLDAFAERAVGYPFRERALPRAWWRRGSVVSAGSGDPRELTEALAAVAPVGLQLAPTVVAVRHTRDGMPVVLAKYPAVAGETLRPLADRDGPPGAASVARARQELERLAAAGWWHDDAERPEAWLVAEPSGTLVLDGWEHLVAADPGTKERLEAAVAVLARVSGRA